MNTSANKPSCEPWQAAWKNTGHTYGLHFREEEIAKEAKIEVTCAETQIIGSWNCNGCIVFTVTHLLVEFCSMQPRTCKNRPPMQKTTEMDLQQWVLSVVLVWWLRWK